MKPTFGGLVNKPRDERNIKLGSFVVLPKLSELPKSFMHKPFKIKDQGASDYCSAYATCAISELQEGVELSPLFAFAVSKMISGDPQEWGQSIINSLKTHTKYGVILEQLSPFNLSDGDKVRYIENWDKGLFVNALNHIKKSYVEITGQYDHYDNARATIWKFRQENRACVIGLDWQWDIAEFTLKGHTNSGFGHLVAIIGYTEQGLIVQNSAGVGAGKDGLHILPREEANYFIEKYGGAFMFIDMSPDELRERIKRGILIDDSIINSLLKSLIYILKTYVSIIRKTTSSFGEIIQATFSKKQD